MDSYFRIICAIFGYCVGCVQTAYIIGRIFGKIDIREHGSGNAGMTNTMRVMGAKAGFAVFIIDFLKVVLVYVICSLIFKSVDIASAYNPLPGLYGGIGVVLGHIFPAPLKFRGGKGIACTLSLMYCVDWYLASAAFVIGLILFLITKYVSFSALFMVLLYVILIVLNGYSTETIIILALNCGLTYFKHSANIKRLIKGEENKFSVHKKEETV